MTKLRLTLREEGREFLERAMKSGRYATESEVVSDAIAELRVPRRIECSVNRPRVPDDREPADGRQTSR